MTRHSRLSTLGWLIAYSGFAFISVGHTLAQEVDEPSPPPAARDDAQDRGESARPQARDDAGETESRASRRESRRDDASRSQDLGITFEGEDELIIGSVAPGSTAAQAGFRPRDRIISVDGRPITGQRRFTGFLSGIMGRRVPIVIDRGGRQYTVQLQPGNGNEQGAWLGVYLQDNEEESAGAVISHIYPAGPAARAGLRPGDTIVSVDGQTIEGAPDLIAALEPLQPRSKVTLGVKRGEQELEMAATLASRDSFITHRGPYSDEARGEPRFAQEGEEDDEFGDVPPYAMQLEHDRRMAEQHERIELELRKLQEEVRALREALQQR